MRTAEEIVDKYYEPNMHWKTVNRNKIIEAVNDARIEAIKECADKAKIIHTHNKRTSVPTGSNFNSVMAHIPVYEVDKQSILSLIEAIK